LSTDQTREGVILPGKQTTMDLTMTKGTDQSAQATKQITLNRQEELTLHGYL